MPNQAPNVVLVLTDQQRFDTVCALGNALIKTPNLDRLVRSGTAFTSAYTPAPVCVPARASLHYGQYPWNTACASNVEPMPTDARTSVMDLLTQAGYRTHGIGKCHFTPDRNALRGFQTRESQEETPNTLEEDDYLQWLQRSPFHYVRDPQGTRSEMVYMPQTSQLPASHHPSQWVGDRAIAFIREQQTSPQPWFLFASFIHPHPPYAPPAPWDKLYRGPDMPDPFLPDGYREQLPDYAADALHHYHLEGPANLPLWRLLKARYYSCISFVDFQVGRILDALAGTDQLEDTLIVFTSDHGDMLGDLGLVGKGAMYDPSSRVPLITSCPKRLPADRRVDSPVSLLDVPVAILAAVHIDIPGHWDGENLLDAARGTQDCVDRVVLSQFGSNARAIYMAVDANWKYVYSAGEHRESLFRRSRDGHDDPDYANTPEGEPQAARLREYVVNVLREAGRTDALDEQSGLWRQWPKPIPSRVRRNMRDNPWADYSVPGYSELR